MAEGGSDFDDWQPPTDAEKKVYRARRERQDKISKLMGDYLLKGYKMLATTCPVCATILLRDKQGTDFCVACRDLSADSDKDDPVLSREAVESLISESRSVRGSVPNQHPQSSLSLLGSPPDVSRVTSAASRVLARLENTNTLTRDLDLELSMPHCDPTPSSPGVEARPATRTPIHDQHPAGKRRKLFESLTETLESKLSWINTQLSSTADTDSVIKLCNAASSCLSCLKTVDQMNCR